MINRTSLGQGQPETARQDQSMLTKQLESLEGHLAMFREIFSSIENQLQPVLVSSNIKDQEDMPEEMPIMSALTERIYYSNKRATDIIRTRNSISNRIEI